MTKSKLAIFSSKFSPLLVNGNTIHLCKPETKKAPHTHLNTSHTFNLLSPNLPSSPVYTLAPKYKSFLLLDLLIGGPRAILSPPIVFIVPEIMFFRYRNVIVNVTSHPYYTLRNLKQLCNALKRVKIKILNVTNEYGPDP